MQDLSRICGKRDLPVGAAATRTDSSGVAVRKRTTSRDWRIVFMRRATLPCLLLVVIHQSTVACSTIFLTDTIARFEAGQEYFRELCLYLAAMAVPYIPGCLSFVMLQRWINESHGSLVDEFTTEVIENRPNYRNDSLRESVTAVLARNSFPVLKDYISFIHDLASFSLNSILSIIVIVALLPSQLAGGYCLSLALCVFIIIGLQKSIATVSSDCEYAYLGYSGILSRIWPNVALGNSHNESIWRTQRESTGNAFYAASNRLEVLRQLGNVLLAAASLGPTIFLIASIVGNGAAEESVIAALIVSLTRIFLILNSLSSLVYRILDYASLHARISVLLDARSVLSTVKVEPPAVPVDISVNGQSVRDISHVNRMISGKKCGRFTITGSNGSGKSTALLELKQELGAASFLLLADHSNLAWRNDDRSLSTGQKLLERINEIIVIENIHYILLDEWDANLDTNNTKLVDTILEQLATTKVIIEVRHRKDQE